jgi:hypothetical protein
MGRIVHQRSIISYYKLIEQWEPTQCSHSFNGASDLIAMNIMRKSEIL